MARDEVIELLKKYIVLLNTEGISVHKAFLYGSYCDETAHESSDIDVMIVTDNYDENDDMAFGKAWRLTRKINSRIEPFLIGFAHFQDKESSPFISMVKTKGIEIA